MNHNCDCVTLELTLDLSQAKVFQENHQETKKLPSIES